MQGCSVLLYYNVTIFPHPVMAYAHPLGHRSCSRLEIVMGYGTWDLVLTPAGMEKMYQQPIER